MFDDLSSGVAWLQEQAQAQKSFAASEEILAMMRTLNHRSLLY